MATIVKNDGTTESLRREKIEEKIAKLCEQRLDKIDPKLVSESVANYLNTQASAVRLDDVSATAAAELVTKHPQYGKLAGRIWLSRLEKCVEQKFSLAMRALNDLNLLSEAFYEMVRNNAEKIDETVENTAENEDFDYFSVRTLGRTYLVKIDNLPDRSNVENTSFEGICETPKYMYMRVALALNIGDLDRAFKVFDSLCKGLYTHATPTLFNAGLANGNYASCYLMQIYEDSLEAVMKAVYWVAKASQAGGGVGLSVSRVRAKGSPVRNGLGRSGGIIPMLRMFNNLSLYVDQGGGRRPGAVAVYLELWHADIVSFVRLCGNVGDEAALARDIFPALWTCDLFMKRALSSKNEMWSLMCPNACPGLVDAHGKAFEELYERYEREGKFVRQISAKSLLEQILRQQAERGMPFMLFKDTANARSNQSHLGTLTGSNLCTEIILPTSQDEVAVCNLASVCLPKFTRNFRTDKCECMTPNFPTFDPACAVCTGGFNYADFYRAVREATRNLDNSITNMKYPTPETERANKRHRPVGVGVQGFAYMLLKLGLSWSDEATKLLNQRVFETLWRAATHESTEMGFNMGSYESFEGSPAKRGMLTPHLWNSWCTSNGQRELTTPIGGPEWLAAIDIPEKRILFDAVREDGLRNSERTTIMPTASTAQILGNSESIEPLTSNIFQRRVISGEYLVVNPYLVQDLELLNMWNDDVVQAIIADGGSIQRLDVPERLKEMYRTAWELDQKILVDRMVERQPWLDQSASLNLYFTNPDITKAARLLNRAHRRGLKTGIYYTHGRAAVEPLPGLATKIECQSCSA